MLMVAHEPRRQIGLVVLVGLVGTLTAIVSPLQAQDPLAPSSVQPAAREQVQVMTGPDRNAIYLRLQAAKPAIVEAPARYVHRSEGEVIVQMKGFRRTDSPGDPALPFQVYHLAVPPEAVARSLRIEVIRLVERELPGGYRVAPAPPYLLDQRVSGEEEARWEFMRWGVGKQIVAGRNILIYEKDAFYPAEYCRVEAAGRLRKWKVATVVYYPIRYNPVKNKLVLAEEIALKIKFERDAAQLQLPTTKALLRDDAFDERARKLFLNYEQAHPWYLAPLRKQEPQKRADAGDAEDAEDPNCAIVTTENIYAHSAQLPAFCFHKQERGYSVMVVTEGQTHTVAGAPGSYSFTDAPGGYETDATGNPLHGDAPDKRPDKIRQWLQDNYLTLGIEYVLLIGNPDPDNVESDDLVGDLPMQLCWPWILSDNPTDLFYSDLSGDWNLDNDGYVGESVAAAGFSILPAGVNGNLFCARWEGVVEVADAPGAVNIRLAGYTEGQTEISFDKDNDGSFVGDVVLPDDMSEHHPTWHYISLGDLTNGTYPVQIKYRQSSGDAYCEFNVRTNAAGVSATFKHDDGTGSYVNGLEADYFNDNDFSDPPDAETVDVRPNAEFIAGGDRGPGGVDFYPEVILGRIPCYDEDEDGNPDYATLNAILTKITHYENAKIHDEGWRRRVLISTPHMYTDAAGAPLADYKGGETLRTEVAPPPFWEWYRIHDEDYGVGAEVTDGCTVDKTVAAWNDPNDPDDGRGVVMWRTHGSQTGADHVFTESRCDDLDDSKPSMVIQTTCQNGHPEVEKWWDGTTHYPLGYSLLKRGAVATLCSTRNSAGGLFDPANIDISYKNNPYLLYFFAQGIFYNVDVGAVLAHVRESDATLGQYWGQLFNYNLYGDPTVSLFGADPRSNNDVVFLLDGSGSMLSEGKWVAAKDAAVLFYQLLKTLRHPAFQDRYASVVFRWPCTTGSADMTTTVPAGTGLQDISIPLTIATFGGVTPLSNYCTPIGSGLEMAIGQFELDTEESFYSNNTVLLLSDGKHNKGDDPLFVTAPEGAGITVHSVGLGEDWIEPDTIRDIADTFGGDYRITPSPREMEDFFIQILCGTSWKLQDVTVAGDSVPIDQGTAVFIVVWDGPGVSLTFDLDPPGAGPNITPSNLTGYAPMAVSWHPPAAGETHAFYVCKNIPSELLGDWRFANINDGSAAVPPADVLLKVIEDPRVIADFDIEDIDHHTGQPIVLSAGLAEDGKPLTGLTEVYAELIRAPAVAAGTIMAENAPSPSYPRRAKVPDTTARTHYLLGVMDKLGLDRLSAPGGAKIPLRDDGLLVDLRAKDGIYTGVYDNTGNEGSYTFRFRARGANRDGVTFDRTETLSEYVKFAPEATATDLNVVSAVVNADRKTITATIKVTPRNTAGAYLGPFRGDLINMWSTAGDFKPGYVDNMDGSYSFTLVHPAGTVPLVSASVGDVIIADRTRAEPKKSE